MSKKALIYYLVIGGIIYLLIYGYFKGWYASLGIGTANRQSPESTCKLSGGTWNAATGTCTPAASGQRQSPALVCVAAGGVYNYSTGACEPPKGM